MSQIQLSAYIHKCAQQFMSEGIDNPSFDAHILIGHTLKLDRAELFSQSERALTTAEITSIDALIQRRLKHESVARIIGEREFWSLPFGLNEATLEPRPDSETLVEIALKKVRHSGVSRNPDNLSTGAAGMSAWIPAYAGMTPDGFQILDLGTGTGCLLLSLLHELPRATGLGIDIAPRAVEQATTNAKNLKLDNRAHLKAGNWFEGIDEKFDLIISNPPYIASKDIDGLMPEVRNYDPKAALDGGDDGLAVYRFLIPQLPHYLKPKGLVVFEVGQGQADDVSALFEKAGFKAISKHKDLGGIERCVAAHIP